MSADCRLLPSLPRFARIAAALLCAAGIAAQDVPPDDPPPPPPDPGAGSTPRPQGDIPKVAMLGTRMVFMGADARGFEPWISDGTGDGTAVLRDIHPDGGSNPRDFTAAASGVYFVATDPAGGEELWHTDGTAAGTGRVVDLRPGGDGSSPKDLQVLGERLVFTADNGVTGRELCLLTGGELALVDVREGARSSRPGALVGAAGRVFFVADDGEHGAELWSTDGTAAGTAMVRDVQQGAQGAEPFGAGGVRRRRAVCRRRWHIWLRAVAQRRLGCWHAAGGRSGHWGRQQ